ncbi:hypothetical protein BKA62DRAFT_27906 [Auriculariales sp. MPI-PUGE-AT-0066]|nr:hypothetical protein BKA62DRAFT_27906 [Auriculariales sp. MPI-PUGE-AT-0066]
MSDSNKPWPPIDVELPSYGPPASSSSASTSGSTPPAPAIARCNFMTIERPHKKIEGAFVIDPNLPVLEEQLPRMSTEEQEAGRRANLRLFSKHDYIKVDVWILDWPNTIANEKQPMSSWLHFDATHDGGDIRIHSLGNAPCKISVVTTHATTDVQLPNDYTGLLTFHRKHGSVSGLLPERVTTISDIGGTLKCFIGDAALLSAPWTGHSLDVRATHGKLKLQFGTKPRNLTPP